MKLLPRVSVENPVLVNMVMLTILIGGVIAGLTLVREMFPESRPKVVLISAPYPGATPLEVEKGLTLRIEEAIKDIEDVDRITSDVNEGICIVQVEMTNEVDDIDQSVTDIKAAIDAIPRDELPEEAEEIQVSKSEPRLPVIAMTLYGDVDELTRKTLGERLRDELLLLPEISDVELSGVRKAELAVEVEPEKLAEYDLSLAEISAAIRSANLDLPGGLVKTQQHDVSLRTLGETDDVDAIADTIVRTTADGELVRVRDLGDVRDGFVDVDVTGRFNGKPAVSATVYKTGDQDAIHIANYVKAFAAGKARRPMDLDWLDSIKAKIGLLSEMQRVYEQAYNDPYPSNVEIRVHSDLSRFIVGRLELLSRNAAWGLCFVFLSLLFFLNVRVAFWVMMGLVLSVCGALVLMHILGVTLNLLTMFGLIIVLGLIVDDAIVVGENIYARVERGEKPREAAIIGAQEVTWPVLVAVLTTIGAFVPLMFIEGRMGDFMGVLPVVVMCALGVSLIEAFSILPSHLAEALKPPKIHDAGAGGGWLARVATPFRRAERNFVENILTRRYEQLLRLAVEYRYATIAIVAGVLLLTAGLVGGKRVRQVYLQKMDSETIMADLTMPVGTPSDRTLEAMSVIENACLETEEIKNVWAVVGAQYQAGSNGMDVMQRSHLAQVIIELKEIEQRDRTSDDIIADLRAQTADIPGVNSLQYQAMQGGPGGAEIELEVTGEQMNHILAAVDALKTALLEYEGVSDLADDYEGGRPELQIELLDSARPLGLTTRSLATEIRGAFYGLEARTLQRGREDVDIRVRFPENRRKHIYELEDMRVVTPGGFSVPFCETARLVETRGVAGIRRINQRRAVTVTADVEQREGVSTETIVEELTALIAKLEREHPGLRIEFGGNRRQFAKSFASLKTDFMIALMLIYFMLAGLFRSYVQPMVALASVPFGMIGVVLGHYFMGYPMTILSNIGAVALAGIVVNDALILVDFINKEIEQGMSIGPAVINAGVRRLRPILLTSLTTILGLAPLLTETSFQAKFLIPMAISISFGLAFATALTLIVVPVNYMIVDDMKRLLAWIWHGRRPTTPETAGDLASMTYSDDSFADLGDEDTL